MAINHSLLGLTRLGGELLVLDCLARECNTFVDVGANVGRWTEEFAHRNEQALGFLVEPSLECIKTLTRKFERSKYKLFEYALANYVGEADFIEETGHGETSSLAISYDSPTKEVNKRRVSVTTLDDLFGNYEGLLDFIKIDTEGTDYLVVKGAQNLIAAKRVKFIQFEYNTNWTRVGASLHVMRELLESSGYSLFLIRSDGLYNLDWDKWKEYFFWSNYLAIRNENVGCVSALRRGSI